MKRILAYSLLILIIGFLVLGIVIISYGNKVYTRGDSGIVLGAATWGDLPSPVFKARIDYAISLYKSGAISNIYFTGGSDGQDTLSEGEVAKQYSIDRGVLPENILIETTSKTTFQNLKNIAPYIDKEKQVLIITDPLHEFRSVRIARSLGINAYPSPTPYTQYVSLKTTLPFLAREVYFTVTNWVLGI